MFDWNAFTLFLYIVMRMSGFFLFHPVFARTGIPSTFRAGLVGLMSINVLLANGGGAEVPETVFALGLRLFMELLIGYVLSTIMRFFLYIAEQGGEIVDTQMGMSMARNYDPTTNSSSTVMANILNLLMLVLFVIANGHITLLRMILTSGEIVPFGAVAVSPNAMLRCLELFTECALLALKLALPVLGAELMGQVGMGILMKVIPQINVFAINIELKVIIGLAMMSLMLSPMSEFLLEAENYMLRSMREVLGLMQ